MENVGIEAGGIAEFFESLACAPCRISATVASTATNKIASPAFTIIRAFMFFSVAIMIFMP
jgi:hypothetical protein